MTMLKNENFNPDRGVVLLAELKSLVDSFPAERRTDVIKIIKSVIQGLSAQCCECTGGRRLADEQPVSDSSAGPTAGVGR